MKRVKLIYGLYPNFPEGGTVYPYMGNHNMPVVIEDAEVIFYYKSMNLKFIPSVGEHLSITDLRLTVDKVEYIGTSVSLNVHSEEVDNFIKGSKISRLERIKSVEKLFLGGWKKQKVK